MRLSTRATIVLAWLMTACAHPGAGTSRGAARSDNVLTQPQLAATNAQSVYDALRKLRPEWLSSRGATSVTDDSPTVASVYMNGTMLGRAEYLRDVPILDVTSVRYWDAGQASARFGMGHPRGVIEITRK